MLVSRHRPRVPLYRLLDGAALEGLGDFVPEALYGKLRGAIKAVAVITVLASYLALAGLLNLLLAMTPLPRPAVRGLTRVYSRILLKLIGVKIVLRDPQGLMPKAGSGTLLVANHISYLDAPLMMRVLASVFVTSCDIEETPGLGNLTKAAGCVFVERRTRMKIRRDIQRVAELLRQGHNVVLFPEGSTSDGMHLLPFKSPLFKAAVDAQTTILPVCVRYLTNRDQVAWYGDMTFLPHLYQLMECSEVTVEVTLLEPVRYHNHGNRKLACAEARDKIGRAYHQP